MASTDNPLKMLISSFSEVFAEWLLGSRPRFVRPLNVDLPATAKQSDLLFEVIQTDGQIVLLHIELQGRRSHQPMPWRMLDYMSRLALRELGEGEPQQSIRLNSFVIYLGHGAGLEDSGQYELLGVEGQPSMSWRYQPIRLWQMEAEELLALGEPALLALIGQTRLLEPESTLSRALANIRIIEDESRQGRLLAALVSLISDEEIVQMVEKMLDATDEFLLDLPYLKRIRQQSKEEGLAEGLAEGKEEGIVEGLREAILEAITLHFNPPALEYRQVSQQLAGVTDHERLKQLHTAAIQAEDMAVFTAQLAEALSDQ
jgi:predicted transposase YdaD